MKQSKPKRARKRQGVTGPVRADHRSSNLLHRIEAGDVALISQEDIDRQTAESLVERGVAAVLNAEDSASGRSPNAGSFVLTQAKIPLIDRLGEGIFTSLSEDDRVRILDDGAIELDGVEIARGRVVDGDICETAMRRANRNIGATLEGFMRSTVEHLQREKELLLLGEGVPELSTQFAGRRAIVVAKVNRAEIKKLKRMLREMSPIVVAVDKAADGLRDIGVLPNVIVGDLDVVSADALMSGAELVAQAKPDGSVPGLERARALGLNAAVIPGAGSSADIALLLAYEAGADLLVSVGAADSLAELLDSGREGAAAAFVVRLKVGRKLVDAETASRLYSTSIRTRHVVGFVAASIVALTTAGFLLPGPREALQQAIDSVTDLFRGVFG